MTSFNCQIIYWCSQIPLPDFAWLRFSSASCAIAGAREVVGGERRAMFLAHLHNTPNHGNHLRDSCFHCLQLLLVGDKGAGIACVLCAVGGVRARVGALREGATRRKSAALAFGKQTTLKSKIGKLLSALSSLVPPLALR